MAQQSDRIVKQVVLNASLDRVWTAISEATQFGTWFGMEFDGKFEPGTRITGKISPTKVDAEVAAMQEPHAGKSFEFFVESIEPKRLFSFRWHPFAIDPNVDYSKEPTTLVEFILQANDGGTQLTITESGFDHIPAHRRSQAFTANDGGWTKQLVLIGKYLTMQHAG